MPTDLSFVLAERDGWISRWLFAIMFAFVNSSSSCTWNVKFRKVTHTINYFKMFFFSNEFDVKNNNQYRHHCKTNKTVIFNLINKDIWTVISSLKKNYYHSIDLTDALELQCAVHFMAQLSQGVQCDLCDSHQFRRKLWVKTRKNFQAFTGSSTLN